MKPASKQDAAQKQKIKDMLRDAIRVLCQNVVLFDEQLSIEAVIGITVDGGTDMLIVSIQESIGNHSGAVSNETSCQAEAVHGTTFSSGGEGFAPKDEVPEDQPSDYHDEQTYDGTRFDEGGSNNPEQHYYNDSLNVQYNKEQCYNATPLPRTIIKKSMSVVTYSVPPNPRNETSIKQEMFAEEPADHYGSGQKSNEYGLPLSSLGIRGKKPATMYGSQKMKKTNPHGYSRAALRSGRGGFGTASSARSAVHGANQAALATCRSGWQQQAVMMATGNQVTGVDETVQISLYRCGQCGAQMRNKGSLLRHKLLHTGIAYRCDGCGKMINRADNLQVHRRRCAGVLKQQQHQQYQEMQDEYGGS